MRIETVLAGAGSGPGGATLTGPLAGVAEAAREIEELGFDAASTPETGHDPFLPLMIAAEHTERVRLGTNVAIAFPRSPMVTAQIAWDLQRYSNGRFELGIGTQVKGHNERRYSTPWNGPAGPRMREYVECLRAIFDSFQNGTRPGFQGKHYTYTLMTPFFNAGPIEHPDVPVYISALNPYMAKLSGEICEGVRVHPLVTAKYTHDVLLPAVAEGAKKAGRDPKAIDLVATPFIVTGKTRDEVEANKAGVRQHIAFYASTRTYHAVLDHHGWTEAGQQLHAYSIEGKWGEMGKLINDEMLGEFAVIGTYEEVAPRLAERWGGVASTLFLGLAPAMRADRALMRDMLETLHKA